MCLFVVLGFGFVLLYCCCFKFGVADVYFTGVGFENLWCTCGLLFLYCCVSFRGFEFWLLFEGCEVDCFGICLGLITSGNFRLWLLLGFIYV